MCLSKIVFIYSSFKFEVKISTFAVPYIMGEIKRFIRDDGPIKVSRSIKELGAKIREIQRDYLAKNGKDIKISLTCHDGAFDCRVRLFYNE